MMGCVLNQARKKSWRPFIAPSFCLMRKSDSNFSCVRAFYTFDPPTKASFFLIRSAFS